MKAAVADGKYLPTRQVPRCRQCGAWMARGWVLWHDGVQARKRKCGDCQVKATRERVLLTGQRAAHLAVAAHVAAGLLRPVTEFVCVDCGAPATKYDHRDYNEPLRVEPVCHGCNMRRGAARPIRREAA